MLVRTVVKIWEVFEMYLREKGLMFQFPMIVLGRSWSAARKGGSGATGDRDRKPEGDNSDGWTTVGGR